MHFNLTSTQASISQLPLRRAMFRRLSMQPLASSSCLRTVGVRWQHLIIEALSSFYHTYNDMWRYKISQNSASLQHPYIHECFVPQPTSEPSFCSDATSWSIPARREEQVGCVASNTGKVGKAVRGCAHKGGSSSVPQPSNQCKKYG